MSAPAAPREKDLARGPSDATVHPASYLEDHPRSNPRLYNDDIAPRDGHGTWGTGNLFNWWMSAWHSLGGYAFAVGLFALGLNGWQTLLGLSLGMLVMLGAANLMGVAGQKAGVPFAVFARMSFGVFGANIPALIRAVVAVAWYGIQTYLAAMAVKVLVIRVWSGAAAIDGAGFLGLSGLEWICLLALWALQLLVLQRGMETVKKFSDFAGPTIWVAMLALALWVLAQADWKLDWTTHFGGEAPTFWGGAVLVCGAAFSTLSYMAGPILNFADFTRLGSSAASVRRGNSLGLVLNGIAFALVSVVIGIASAEVYGEPVTDPIALIAELDNVSLVLVAAIAVSAAQVGVNVICNFVSASFDFAHLWPKRISFKIGGAITAVLSIVIMPWKVYSTPVLVNTFLGGVGALIGPLFGIIMADFYLRRKQRVRVADLYTDGPQGVYHYNNGVNWRNVAAFVVAGAVTMVIALVDTFSDLAPFSWLIGVVLGGLLSLVFQDRNHPVA
ncbi:NCS1 family nucleobase:cation symporter-1 [Corynebacterium variabile]|uniref:NCS1 family nucleobase:cation symporter-1 n=1 Tax=Corynebacterium variabile TaxID=1727 RepID=UPI00264A12C3|nr:NCS1 family nucleobase:cation symporter-1 [Corynebacterium variabile]MDN6478783.1 NCS1 family nucleobase:cation symporter-1 [Corynebacterium variabile]